MSPTKDIAKIAYNQFSREQWGHFRHDEPLTLTADDIVKLRGQMEDVSLAEVEQIYLPLSRLLSFYVTAAQQLHQVTGRFLNRAEPKVPFIIGIAGSVAVGKSTSSRLLQALLSRWPNHPRVQIMTTDGFLLPNLELEKQKLMHRKGFPESYDVASLISTLQKIKAGEKNIKAPIYSHHAYDVIKGAYEVIQQPDIIILEGLNILQTHAVAISVSDFLDFSIYVDAPTALLKEWYVERVMKFWQGPFQDEKSYFHYLTGLNSEEIIKFAEKIWREINEENLNQNILPYKYRATLIMQKGEAHTVEKVWLRK